MRVACAGESCNLKHTVYKQARARRGPRQVGSMTVVRRAAASRPGPGYCRPVEASDRGNESKIRAAPAGAAANDELQPLTRSELAPSSYVAAPSGDSGPSGLAAPSGDSGPSGLATRKADSDTRLAGPGCRVRRGRCRRRHAAIRLRAA